VYFCFLFVRHVSGDTDIRVLTYFKFFRTDTVPSLQTGRTVLRTSVRERIVSFLQSVQTSSEVCLAPLSVQSGALSPDHEADHSSQSSAKVKNKWICTSAPPL
jgi:hypothetical protein